MTGSITAEIQAAGPEISEIIDQAGQDVIIRCPGQPDTFARAVLYQEDNKGEGKVSNPEFKVLGWQGVFKPDAPLRHGPFTVIDQQGRQFVPDGPAQDPAEQGVALIVHLLPLAERTRLEHLTFTVAGAGTVRDGRGNLVPAPGTPLAVSARLSATTDPRIRDMVGADAATVVLVGRWGTLDKPLLKPAGVAWGSKAPLVLDGQAGTLTVKLAYPDPDLAQEQQFGSRFVAVWQAG